MEVILTTIAAIFKPDERFVAHRYYSTRLSMIVGVLLIIFWFSYQLIVYDTFRTDLAVIASVMAITKVISMIFYQITK